MFEKPEIGPKSWAFAEANSEHGKTGGGPDKGAQRRSRILLKLGSRPKFAKDTKRLGILQLSPFRPEEDVRRPQSNGEDRRKPVIPGSTLLLAQATRIRPGY